MGLPGDGQIYVRVKMTDSVSCPECNTEDVYLAVANEAIFNDEGQFLGIEAVVRLWECGHPVDFAEADPVRVAKMLDFYENACDDPECEVHSEKHRAIAKQDEEDE